MARPDYCPVGNEPCQSMCDEPCSWSGSKRRREDDALILQLVEALESSNVEWKQLADSSDAGFWRAEDQDYYQQSEKAIAAGRAWLEGFDNAIRRTRSAP